MADITKCDGKGCDLKEKCYRFTANDGFRQSYFAETPINGGVCDYFWEDKKEYPFDETINIIYGKP